MTNRAAEGLKQSFLSFKFYQFQGNPCDLADSAAAGALSLVLDGVGGGVGLPGHHRAQPPLQEA